MVSTRRSQVNKAPDSTPNASATASTPGKKPKKGKVVKRTRNLVRDKVASPGGRAKIHPRDAPQEEEEDCGYECESDDFQFEDGEDLPSVAASEVVVSDAESTASQRKRLPQANGCRGREGSNPDKGAFAPPTAPEMQTL